MIEHSIEKFCGEFVLLFFYLTQPKKSFSRSILAKNKENLDIQTLLGI